MTKFIVIILFIIVVVWGTGSMIDNIETDFNNTMTERERVLNTL